MNSDFLEALKKKYQSEVSAMQDRGAQSEATETRQEISLPQPVAAPIGAPESVQVPSQPIPGNGNYLDLPRDQWERYKLQIDALLKHYQIDCADLQLKAIDCLYSFTFKAN